MSAVLSPPDKYRKHMSTKIDEEKSQAVEMAKMLELTEADQPSFGWIACRSSRTGLEKRSARPDRDGLGGGGGGGGAEGRGKNVAVMKGSDDGLLLTFGK